MRAGLLRRCVRGLILAAAVVTATSTAFAATGAPPSPERLHGLSAALDTSSFVRVHTRRGTFETRRAFADTAGVHVLGDAGRRALIVTAAADSSRPEQRLLPWRDVERVEVGRGREGTPAILGLAIGAAVVGGAVALTRGQSGSGEATAPVLFGAGLVAVVSTAAGLWSTGSPPTRTVYP